MLTVAELQARVAELEGQKQALQNELEKAQARLFWYAKFHGSLIGEFGERLVTQWPGITRILGNKGHDACSSSTGTYEIKTSSWHEEPRGVSGYWQWSKLRGEQKQRRPKQYDFAILIGESRQHSECAGNCASPVSPFVFFLVPRNEIETILDRQKRPEIRLCATPKPLNRKNWMTRDLLYKRQVTLEQLEEALTLSAKGD